MPVAKSWAGVALALLPVAAFAQAATAPAAGSDVEELRRRLEEQEQKTAVLERKLEIQDETARGALPNTPVVKAGPKGFSIASQDGANVIKLRGLVHFDGRYYLDDAGLGGADSWRATRIRPILEGTLYSLVDFRLMPDFGQGRTVIQDAWVTGRFKPWFQVTAGKFKSPVGLERLQSASDIRFQDRGYPTLLAPNRDLGLQLSGNVLADRLTYQIAFLNGSNDGGSSETFSDADVSDDKEWAVRLFAQPFAGADNFLLRGLGVGLAGTVTEQKGTNSQTLLSSFRTPAGQNFFSYRVAAAASGANPATNSTIQDGDRVRLTPQLYWYSGSVGLLAEYINVETDVSRQATATDPVRRDTLDNNAWQVQLSWFATGEEESYKGFTPDAVFVPGGDGWGALEFVARYQELDVDDAAFTDGAQSFADPAKSASEAKSAGVGVNWYLNQNIKVAVEYEHTSFTGGATGGADLDDENALLTRVQLSF
ncbi:MAG: porin [Gammaproteobacteria bacterium]|nr:porin [Gammaproteobacteria bacterium]